MDIFNSKFVKKDYKPSKPTKKVAFIGGSNKGKTMHMINYFIHIIKTCSGIVIVAPKETHKDEKKLILKEWCEDAGMPIFFLTEDTFEKAPKFPDECVYMIDDCYTSTERNTEVEHLIKRVVNNGRHEGQHLLYAAHLPIRLPSEIKYNCSNMFIHVQFAIQPDTYEKLSVRDASEYIKEKTKTLDPHAWYIYDDSDIFKGKAEVVEWPKNLKTRKDIVETIKSKLPKKNKEEITKLVEKQHILEDVKTKQEEMAIKNENHKEENSFSMIDVLAGKYYDPKAKKTYFF